MKKRALSNIEIHSYGCFDKIEIKKLSMINCIYGAHNSGKTTILNAVMSHIPENIFLHDLYRLLGDYDRFGLHGNDKYSKTLNIWKMYAMFRCNGDILITDINKILNNLDIKFRLKYDKDNGEFYIIFGSDTYHVDNISKYESDILFKIVPLYLSSRHYKYKGNNGLVVLDDIENKVNNTLISKYLLAIIKFTIANNLQLIFTTASPLVIDVLNELQRNDITYLSIQNRKITEVTIDEIKSNIPVLSSHLLCNSKGNSK